MTTTTFNTQLVIFWTALPPTSQLHMLTDRDEGIKLCTFLAEGSGHLLPINLLLGHVDPFLPEKGQTTSCHAQHCPRCEIATSH